MAPLQQSYIIRPRRRTPCLEKVHHGHRQAYPLPSPRLPRILFPVSRSNAPKRLFRSSRSRTSSFPVTALTSAFHPQTSPPRQPAHTTAYPHPVPITFTTTRPMWTSKWQSETTMVVVSTQAATGVRPISMPYPRHSEMISYPQSTKAISLHPRFVRPSRCVLSARPPVISTSPPAPATRAQSDRP
ncbi:hypothetical protein BDZ89DRAFT_254842 [Hymenopellis radicata]|nr:hypothetical protein BDZ89DRAFT_254842 [Hymenopellis radicata]